MSCRPTVARQAAEQPSPADGVAGADPASDAVLSASRLLLAVSAQSIALADESITLPQFRVLVLLSSRGSMTVSGLVAHMNISVSTGIRVIDQLVAAALADRQGGPTTRREAVVGLTRDGAATVARASRQRRQEIAKIVAALPVHTQRDLVVVLEQFNEAGEEPPANADLLGDLD